MIIRKKSTHANRYKPKSIHTISWIPFNSDVPVEVIVKDYFYEDGVFAYILDNEVVSFPIERINFVKTKTIHVL